MKRTVTESFNIPIFSGKFHVIFADDAVAVMATSKWPELFGEHDLKYVGGMCCSSYEKRVIAIFFNREDMSHNLIAHECTHAMFRLIDMAGFAMSEETQEPCAYLQGWFAQTIYDAIRKHRERVIA